MNKISGWLTRLFKKVEDKVEDVYKKTLVDIIDNASKAPRQTHKVASRIHVRDEIRGGPVMLPVSKTMKRRFPTQDVRIYNIDWRSLERNKYAPWGVGHNAQPHPKTV